MDGQTLNCQMQHAVFSQKQGLVHAPQLNSALLFNFKRFSKYIFKTNIRIVFCVKHSFENVNKKYFLHFVYCFCWQGYPRINSVHFQLELCLPDKSRPSPLIFFKHKRSASTINPCLFGDTMAFRKTSGASNVFCLISSLLIAAESLASARSSRGHPGKYIVPPADEYGYYLEEFKCEVMEIELCKKIGYNYTQMPNNLGHERQNEAAMLINSYIPLLESNCSKDLLFFLCAVHVPMCSEAAKRVLGPCEGMCRAVERKCKPVMKSFEFEWPPYMNCSNFHKVNTPETLCMEGSKNEKPKPEVETPQHFHCK